MRASVVPLCALVLAGCDLSQAPLDPGTFELTVSGDLGTTATGRAIIAMPDSGLNVTDNEWQVGIPIHFDPSGASDVEFEIYVAEPTEPNGAFREIPGGTFPLDRLTDYDPSDAHVVVGVRVGGEYADVDDGTLRLTRTAFGVEGVLDALYDNSNPTYHVGPGGRVRARFHAVPEISASGRPARPSRGRGRTASSGHEPFGRPVP